MTRRGTYARLLAESGLIVGSILLAFAIDAWWEDKLERREELEILLALSDEFADNREAIAEVVALHREAENSFLELSRMQPSAVVQLDTARAFALRVDLMRFNTFDDRIGTLDGVIASGKLGLIRSEALRSRLSEWRGTLDDLGEEADLLVRASERVLQREAELGVTFSNDPLEQALVTLVADEELMVRVRAKISMAAIYYGDLRILDELAADVEEELRAAIAGHDG